MYFDTHAHYDDEAFKDDAEELLSSMPEHGISLILNPGSDKLSLTAAVKSAKRFEFVYAAVGIHPHYADDFGGDDLDFMRLSAKEEKVKAIGEIGLDYHYDHSPRDLQRSAFVSQMELARELKLPVIVHDREAHGDCMEIIRRFPDVPGVFHCYSGSPEMAAEIVDMGWYLSFTGAVTYKNSKKAAETIKKTPIERIMIETDAPYLTPEPHRGKRNDSRYLPLVAQAVADLKNMSVEKTAALTTGNGRRFFGID
ncbi:MAG: TatD family hydrolase [Oscillospiraceae bacterium]|nr:TatD family hydrolase [Oscillospiraceae bacterium]